MGIVSVSLGDSVIEEINQLEDEFGFRGRSEVVRAGIKLLLDEMKQRSAAKGKVDALLVLVHSDFPAEVSKIRHNFDAIIQSQIHNHLSNGKCSEIFILRGEGAKVKKMADACRTNKRIESVKLVIS